MPGTTHESEEKAGAVDASRAEMQFRISRGALVLLAALTLAPWLLVAVVAGFKWPLHRSAKPAVQSEAVAGSRVTHARPGPWGDIEFIRIAIEPPAEFVFIDEKAESPAWFLRGHSRPQVEAFLNGAALTPEQRAELLGKSSWEVKSEGVTVRPPPDLVLSLAGEARERIYNLLALYPENRPQNSAYSFNPHYLDERLESSGLTEATVALFRRLLYRHGDLLLFADLNLLLPRLPDDHERTRLVKTVSRKITMLANLKVTPQTDVDTLVNYWGFDGRAKDLRPLIESLKRVPGGASLDLAHLLPPFARRRLYTYPIPSNDSLAARRDCHWTSLNFFEETPNDRYVDQVLAVKTIGANYYQISGGARLGDLMLLMTGEETVVHSAVYVADDVVFTKNGAMPTQPWMLMRLDDLEDYYAAFQPPNQPLRVRIYREKELVPVRQSPGQ